MQTIRLSKAEVAYLTASRFLSQELQQMVIAAATMDTEGLTFHMEREIAERFCDEFTARLAKAGFDEKYEPNDEGKILDGLIDRFTPAA